jgi:hypothetical protein
MLHHHAAVKNFILNRLSPLELAVVVRCKRFRTAEPSNGEQISKLPEKASLYGRFNPEQR